VVKRQIKRFEELIELLESRKRIAEVQAKEWKYKRREYLNWLEQEEKRVKEMPKALQDQIDSTKRMIQELQDQLKNGVIVKDKKEVVEEIDSEAM